MFSGERVTCRRVRLHVEQRRFPSLNRMARGAFALIGALRELCTVRVVFVAIRTARKRQRPAKISAGVALQAIQLRMHSKQWIFRLRVIELSLRGNCFPRGCGVARLARLPGKGALMRIGVAIAAFRECYA